MTRGLAPGATRPASGRLADAPAGAVRVAGIAAEDAAALAEVGVRLGVLVRVERRLPFGGPVLLDVGAARVAVARAVAARTSVVPAHGPGPGARRSGTPDTGAAGGRAPFRR
jgi:Fe2+ transport system protein FeoA